MRILVSGASGYVGGALVPGLLAEGHELRLLARSPERVRHFELPVVRGDAVTGAGLERALGGMDVAYYLIHSMEPGAENGSFAARERRAAEHFVDAARRGGVRRIVYLGGLVPRGRAPSAHLSSRLAVEQTLLEGVREGVALRASIVVGARSRSFRFLVRLVERLPMLLLPPWRIHRTQPIDGRDVTSMLVRAASVAEVAGQSLDIAGPDVVTYGEMIERIRDLLLVGRPVLELPFAATPLASRVAATIAGEEHELIGPLMEGLTSDLLPRDARAARLLGVRLHSFEAAVERALREWEEAGEPLAAR